jgi:hypothetical protein
LKALAIAFPLLMLMRQKQRYRNSDKQIFELCTHFDRSTDA